MLVYSKITQNINNQRLSCKNKENNAIPSFKGLQTVMQKAVYCSPETLQKLMGVYKWNDGIVGTIPEEMIKKFLADGAKHSDMPNLTKTITNSVGEAVKALRNAEMLGAQVSSSFDLTDFTSKITSLVAEQDVEGINQLTNSIYGMGALPRKEMRKLEQQAETILAQAFKQVGLLPHDGLVSVKRLGNGMFGNAFNLSFRDTSGNKLFHDKVLKIFKDPEAEEIAIRNIAKKSFDFYDKMTLEEFIEYCNKVTMDTIEAMKKNNTLGLEALDMNTIMEGLKANRPIYEATYNIQKNMSLDDSINMYRAQLKQMGKFHGVNAEANRSMFLRKIGGDMKNTDYVPQHFYDLENRYAFVEMADSELPQVKRKIDLEKYGLAHGDIDINTANTVCGRVIDIGGIAAKAELEKPQEMTSMQKKIATSFEKAIEDVQQNFDKLAI